MVVFFHIGRKKSKKFEESPLKNASRILIKKNTESLQPSV